MPEKPDDDPFHDCELGPDAVLGTRTFHDVLFTDDTETPVNVLTGETPAHSQATVDLLSNTVNQIDNFGVQRSRKAVYDWVQKAGLQPVSDASPDQIAVDETVIRIDGQQYWLYAAVNANSNKFLHIRLFPTTTTALTERFLQELREKHDVEDAVFLVDHAQHLKTALQRVGLRFQTVRHRNRNAVEHIFREIKR